MRHDGAGPRGRTLRPACSTYRARSRTVSREGMVEEAVKTYHVTYERDESGWWVAFVRGLRGCHTQGRTVDEARRRIVEAMELFVDNARSAKIVDDVRLPQLQESHSRVCDAAQKSRTGRSSCGTGGSAGGESPSWRTPEDERARRRTRVGPVASACPPARTGQGSPRLKASGCSRGHVMRQKRIGSRERKFAQAH